MGNSHLVDAEREVALRLFSQLGDESKAKFLAWVRWACNDGCPETDPRNNDPYWARLAAFQAKRAQEAGG